MRQQQNGTLIKLALCAAVLALAGCSSVPLTDSKPAPTRPAATGKTPARPDAGVPALPAAGSGKGGYYQDDGPGENPPANLADVPDAEVRNDPLLPRSNRPYVVFGKTYTPIAPSQSFSQRGVGSWYGKKFHGQRTSSGEIYDMYKMTAAHPTLPIPSYARVSNAVTGAQVIVRINDRGPFHSSRVIDVSYTAALKLGLLSKGSHELQIERIMPAEIERMQAARGKGGTSNAANAGVGGDGISGVVTEAVLPAAPASARRLDVAALTPAAPTAQELQALRLGDGAAGGAVVAAVATDGAGATATSASAVPAVLLATAQPKPMAAGFYLQLGAFARQENAEAVRARLAQAEGNPGQLEVVQGGAVYRLFSGPFASRQEAAQAMQAMPVALGIKAIIVQR
ncbi:septal ring lytic transglycosylase RlpA family protein [Oxalobacteraceae bacterium]|nr:septal ring lytic transglycosylase RlpA family protein [Oxalobacteraceae bacterium]